MRSATRSALCAFALSVCFSYPAAAQSNAASPQVPEALLRKLSLPAELAGLQNKAESPARELSGNATLGPNGIHEEKSLQDWLRQHHIDPALLESSGECGHILIYVPPITDTKMIIKVPEGVANGEKAPTVKACGADLRRVDAPRLVPRSAPGRDTGQSPLRDASFLR